jgi:hypothetical protein
MAVIFDKLRRMGLLLCLLILTACASAPEPNQEYKSDWPSDLPPQAFFNAHYSQDAYNQQLQSKQDYLKWVKRFYYGWAYKPKGWEWMTASVLKQTTDYNRRLLLKRDLQWLGENISAEWAKHARSRRINTAHMMIWGDALKIAMRSEEPEKLTSSIAADVQQLLNGELTPAQITIERYIDLPATALVLENAEFQDPFEF